MNTAYQHLGLTPDIIDNFALQANLIVDGQMQSLLEKRIRELSRISERFADGGEVVAPKESVDKVITKTKRLSKKVGANDNEWSPIELRILSYNLGQISNEAIAFDYAANLIDRNWRNMFFNGLLFCLLNDWLSPQQDFKNSICNLLKRKLEKYDGSNQRFLALKNHANFLDANGPLRLATLLVHQSKSVLEAPTIFGYKESTLSFSYYSDVILHYFNLRDTFEVPLLEEIFALHQLDRTKKLILAMMVEQAEKEGKEFVQTQVSKFAQAILGDIALSSTWAPFPNATQNEIEKLRRSQILVNQWNARKAINTFFELCVQDAKRKEFWLKYANFVNDFRIAGSKAVNTKLLGDERIRDIISDYFIKTNSESGRTSALILFIRDKVFIEFSDKGAIYVYNQKHRIVRSVRERNKVSSIDYLKSPEFDMLVEHYGEVDFVYDESSYYEYRTIDLTTFNDEGKMFHIGYWDERLHAWIQNKLGIYYKKPKDFRYSPPPTNTHTESLQSESTDTVVSQTSKPITYSKLLFDCLCRVEGHEDGIYLRICKTNELVLLANKNMNQGGNIWIKKKKNYEEVYYHTSEKDDYLGFLSLWDFSDKKIKFYPLYGDDIEIPLD